MRPVFNVCADRFCIATTACLSALMLLMGMTLAHAQNDITEEELQRIKDAAQLSDSEWDQRAAEARARLKAIEKVTG